MPFLAACGGGEETGTPVPEKKEAPALTLVPLAPIPPLATPGPCGLDLTEWHSVGSHVVLYDSQPGEPVGTLHVKGDGVTGFRTYADGNIGYYIPACTPVGTWLNVAYYFAEGEYYAKELTP